jgi:hypothetical protein
MQFFLSLSLSLSLSLLSAPSKRDEGLNGSQIYDHPLMRQRERKREKEREKEEISGGSD